MTPKQNSVVRIARRDFLRGAALTAGAAFIDSFLPRSLLGDRVLLAEAAELSREVITVDLHCHPNDVPGQHFPEIDPSVPENMKAGGLDVGLFAVRGDYPLIRRDSAGRRYESRQPRSGELLRRSSQQLDGILNAVKEDKLTLARSPAEIFAAKKNGSPCALLAIEGSDPLEGELARVKSFYDRGVRVLQLMHFRINEIGDIQTADPRHKGLTQFGRDVVREMKASYPDVDVLRVEGGWSAVLRVPAVRSEEELAVELVRRHGVVVHPGYFFEFPREAFVVVSLLVDTRTFDPGVAALLAFASGGAG